MNLRTKQWIIGILGAVFMASLLFVQAMEVIRKREESGVGRGHVAVPANSKSCVDCHLKTSPGIVDHWTGSMGEGAAIGLRAAAGATLVGTPMAGLRGAIESFPLPCLGASVRLPVERLYSVDGTPRELAQPDVIVTEAELAAAGLEDAILGRALQIAP